MRNSPRAAAARARGALIASMFIFGTIGLVRRELPLPSGLIALARAMIGLLLLLAWAALRKKPLALAAARPRLGALCLSGALMGLNWILLFEAYRYASVAVVTLCYYMAPVLVTLAAPLLLRERMTIRRAFCAAAAAVGVALVSGLPGAGPGGPSALRGILLGLGAALFYACVVLLNKRIHGVAALVRTIVQLAAASAVLLPYTLLAEAPAGLSLQPRSVLLLLVVGALHTGVAYALYFGSMEALSAQTVALLSYLDPIAAVALSALLGEPLGPVGCAGAVLILGGACASELPERSPQPKKEKEATP